MRTNCFWELNEGICWVKLGCDFLSLDITECTLYNLPNFSQCFSSVCNSPSHLLAIRNSCTTPQVESRKKVVPHIDQIPFVPVAEARLPSCSPGTAPSHTGIPIPIRPSGCCSWDGRAFWIQSSPQFPREVCALFSEVNSALLNENLFLFSHRDFRTSTL